MAGTTAPLVNGAPAPWGDLGSLLDDVAATALPDVGVTIDDRFESYAILRESTLRIASGLQGRGVGPGKRVCTLLQTRIEVLHIWFGTVMTGAVWVPLNTGLQGDDLRHILQDAEPDVIVADGEGWAKIGACGFQSALAPDMRFTVEADSGFGDAHSFDELRSNDPDWVRPCVIYSDPAVIIYTGGTTGLPKGVVLPHFAMICGGIRYGEAFAATSADRHFSVSPLFHAGGLTIAVLGPMIARMHTTVDRTFSVSGYWARVRESRATLINPIGVILTMLCRQPTSDEDRNHSVRACLGVTGQLPDGVPAEFSRRFGIEIVNIYSLSEASGALMVYNHLGSSTPAANGKGRHWADVAILDKTGNLLPAGALGEIALRPKIPFTFMLGYHRNPVRTLEVFSNLWLHTGDLGYLDHDGFLFFEGREAHWLRRRGENISCYEVEAIIAQHPGVDEVAVVGTPAEIGEEDVKVFIVTKADVRIDPADFIHWCAARMAAFKVPRFVEFVSTLPRSTAKREVERHVLRAMPNDGAWDREKVFGRKIPAAPRS